MVISEEIIAFIASKKKFIIVVKWGRSDKVLVFGMTLFNMRFEWLTIFQRNSTNRTPGKIIWRKTGIEIFIELLWFRFKKIFTIIWPIWIIWYGPNLRWVLFWKINHPWLCEAVLNKLKIHQIQNQWLKCLHWNTREVILKQKNDLWSLRNQKSNDRWGLCLKTDFKLSRIDFDSHTSFILDGANIKQSARFIQSDSLSKLK